MFLFVLIREYVWNYNKILLDDLFYSRNRPNRSAGVQGLQGTAGETGPTGPTGPAGPQGIQGTAGETPNITIGTVTTGNPGTQAAATITGTPPNFVLNLTIPQGPTGGIGG